MIPILALILWLLLPAGESFAQDSKVLLGSTTDGQAAELSADRAERDQAGAGPVLSTEMSNAVDSLEVVPDEFVVEKDGGFQRVNIEQHVFRRETPVIYSSGGRRDPFRALIVDEQKEGDIVTDLLQLEGAVLTGVVWSEGEYLAMVRDSENRSFFLREGDKIYQGYVRTVTQTEAQFEVSEFGDYRLITLKVQG